MHSPETGKKALKRIGKAPEFELHTLLPRNWKAGREATLPKSAQPPNSCAGSARKMDGTRQILSHAQNGRVAKFIHIINETSRQKQEFRTDTDIVDAGRHKSESRNTIYPDGGGESRTLH